jgi:hypothetical protein
MPETTSEQDSVIFILGEQLKYINEISASSSEYDSLVYYFAGQLDSLNAVQETNLALSQLSGRLAVLSADMTRDMKRKKEIDLINSELEQLKSEAEHDPYKTDSLLTALAVRIDQIENYSLIKIFTPLKNTWEAGAGLGQSYYSGDFSSGGFDSKHLYLYGGLFVRYNFNSKFALKLAYNRGKTGFSSSDNSSFQAWINQFNFQGEYTLLSESNLINPGIGAGFSMISSKQIKSVETGDVSDLSPGIPVTVYLKFKPGKNWRLSTDLLVLKPLSDHIDGVDDGSNNDILFYGGVVVSWLFR